MRVDNITSNIVLNMEIEGYLNASNHQKAVEELENIGLKNISLEGTSKQKTENNIVTLRVKANYKNKEINKEIVARYIH